MANTFEGIDIIWGFPGGPTGTLGGGLALSLVQASDFSRKAQKEQVKDGSGNTAGVVYSDHEDSCSIDFIYGSSSLTGTLTCTNVPTPGVLATLTDSNFSPMGATWIVDDVSVSRGNTKAMMAKVTLSRYLNNAGSYGLPS